MEEGSLGNLVVAVVAITFPNFSKNFKTAVINRNFVKFNTLEELILEYSTMNRLTPTSCCSSEDVHR